MFWKGDNIIKVDLDRSLKVAGEPVSGTILVDVAELEKASLEEIHVELKGTIATYVSNSHIPHASLRKAHH